MPKKKTKNENILIKYIYQFNKKTKKEFTIELDKQTLAYIAKPKKTHPDWTKLTCQQCCNCPFEPEKVEYCPVAVHLEEPIEYFRESMSEQKVDLTVETAERTFSKNCDLKSAISSLIGIYMVTSGCPIMNKLRPMVRFHLPFATVEDTTYRTACMYLMAQYFRAKNGKSADWDLKELGEIYEDINLVNFGFMQRLKTLKVENASLNAIIGLDYFGQNISAAFRSDRNNIFLGEIEDLFDSGYDL